MTRSPIYSHFGESIHGASSIRAYGKVEEFAKESEDKVDYNQICFYPIVAADRWVHYIALNIDDILPVLVKPNLTESNLIRLLT